MWWILLMACSNRCGEGGPCRVDGGYYLAEAPEDWDGRSSLPMALYLHGYSRSAEDKIDSTVPRDLRQAGWLTVLPQGKGDTWSNVGAPSQSRDEIPFLAAVLADARDRWPVQEVVVTGFSQGSSMAWDVACYLPGEVDALFGASGSFWQPEPRRCEGPVPVRHTHGTADRVMPLEGRPIGSYHQGSVDEGFATLRATSGCAEAPDEVRELGPETCEVWTTCDAGVELQRCLYEGGHRLPTGWTGRMLDWYAEQ